MAGSPQQLGKIMETHTRFNLSAAFENWRQELAAQPGLTANARRELESHMQDSVTGLQRLGLDDEEAYWLAHRRIGTPRQLSEEFIGENPSTARREKLLWIALSLLGLQLWEAACWSIGSPFVLISWTMRSAPSWMEGLGEMGRQYFASELLYIITALWFAVKFQQNEWTQPRQIVARLLCSRLRFLCVAVPSVLAAFSLMNVQQLAWPAPFASEAVQHFSYSLLSSGSSSLTLVLFIAWLIPGKPQPDHSVRGSIVGTMAC